jgi:hypothetical protein
MPLLATAGFNGTMIFDRWALEELDLGRPINLGTINISATGNTNTVSLVQKGDMDVQIEAGIFITWQDISMPREPVDRTLEDVIKCVANIIPGFERFI